MRKGYCAIDDEKDKVPLFISQAVAARFKRRRKELGLTVRELSTMTGRDPSWHYALEGGRKHILLYEVFLMARALRLSMDAVIKPLAEQLGMDQPIFLPKNARPIGTKRAVTFPENPTKKGKKNG